MDESKQSTDASNALIAEGSSPDDDTHAESVADASISAVRSPIKVHVIDDELYELTFTHLAAHSQIEEVLEDISSPEVAELWSIIASTNNNFKPLTEEKPETVRQFLRSTRLVQEVLLQPQFRKIATDNLLDQLENFLQLADSAQTLKKQIEAAFPPTAFETTFASARPNAPADLLKYDFLILDLVLNNSKEAIDEMVSYLLAMGNVNYPSRIPAIIIMSNTAELTTECLRFSTESQISAAGLLLLPKAKIREKGFGQEGLFLSYQQLERQRDVAHHMRVFMRTWMSALESARSMANTTLWNMDASAMQQIHLSAITENDPYDEHLNELMSREYLWHVESSSNVATALDALDRCFTDKLISEGASPTIGTRFIAPMVNAKVGRNLVSHFTWTGFRIPEALDKMSPEDALKNFNKLVPFGAVLAPETLTPESECLVHITQQCDLNAATRAKNLEKPVQSVQFVVVLPVEVIEHRMPPHDGENKNLVARGISINGKEYDFKLAQGRQLALQIPMFIEHAAKKKLRVVGRLRHDIATHFLSATVNHMTRAASLKTTRVEVKSAHVFLYGKKLENGNPIMFKEHDGTPAVVQVASHDKLYFFQDGTSIRLALWIKAQLVKSFDPQKLNSAAICNTLSIGLKLNGPLTNVVDFMVKNFPLNEVNGHLAPERAPDSKVKLVVVEIPQ